MECLANEKQQRVGDFTVSFLLAPICREERGVGYVLDRNSNQKYFDYDLATNTTTLPPVAKIAKNVKIKVLDFVALEFTNIQKFTRVSNAVNQ